MIRRRALVSATLIALALLLVAPHFTAHRGHQVPAGSSVKPLPDSHDMAQHISMLEQFNAAIQEGAFYPRWQPELSKGYGLPFFNYYPPGFFFLAEVPRVVAGNPVDAIFVTCVVLFAASGMVLYALARLWLSRPASIAGAFLFLITPYHVIDLYWRAALPELTGFFFVPAILYAAHKAATEGRARDIAILALAVGAYIGSHIPVAYLLLITLAVFSIAWVAVERKPRIAINIGAGVAGGIVLSAIYLLPAVAEKNLIREPFSARYPYSYSYITLLPTNDPFMRSLNQSFLALAITLGVALVVSRGRRDTQARLFRGLALVTIFMVTPYSLHIARLIPQINSVSFAWRWLVIVSCFTALTFAFAVHWATFRTLRWQRYASLLALGSALLFNIVVSVSIIRSTLEHPSLNAPVARVEEGYVPVGATDPRLLPDRQRVEVLSGAATVAVRRWGALRRDIDVRATSQSLLRIRTFNFPGWVAKIDGRPASIGIDGDGGQTIVVGPGDHRVEFRFQNTRVRTAATSVSLIALLAIVTMIVRRPRAV